MLLLTIMQVSRSRSRSIISEGDLRLRRGPGVMIIHNPQALWPIVRG